MTPKEMREKLASMLAEARSKLDEITDETPAERAAELEAEHDRIMSDFDALEPRLNRELALEERSRRLNDAPDPRRPAGDGGLTPAVVPGAEDRGADDQEAAYRDAFFAMLANGGDRTALEPEQRAALRAGAASGAEVRAQLTTSGAAGGFLVPEEMRTAVIRAMAAYGPMYDGGIATALDTAGGNPLPMPTVDDTDGEGELHTEGGDPADDGSDDVTFGERELGAFLYRSKWIKISLELLQDTPINVTDLVASLIAERMGRTANKLLTVGTGTGQPRGIAVAAGAGITAAGAASFTADELLELFHSVDPAYRDGPSVRWQFNDMTYLAIRKLKDGDGNYLLHRGDLSNEGPATLLQKPWALNQAMPTISSGNRPIIFGDMSKYYVRRVGGVVIGTAAERFFPQLGLLGLVRFDGDLGDARAVKAMEMA